jgi:hypothetical protein
VDTALLFRNRRLPKATLGSLGTPTRRAVKTPCKAGGVLPRHGRFIFRKSGACRKSLLSFLKRPPKQRRNPRQSRHIPPRHGPARLVKSRSCRGPPPVLLDLILGVRRGLSRCQPFDPKARACQGCSQRRRNNYRSITVIIAPTRVHELQCGSSTQSTVGIDQLSYQLSGQNARTVGQLRASSRGGSGQDQFHQFHQFYQFYRLGRGECSHLSEATVHSLDGLDRVGFGFAQGIFIRCLCLICDRIVERVRCDVAGITAAAVDKCGPTWTSSVTGPSIC